VRCVTEEGDGGDGGDEGDVLKRSESGDESIVRSEVNFDSDGGGGGVSDGDVSVSGDAINALRSRGCDDSSEGNLLVWGVRHC
jgi:hypothetical protein